MNLSKYITYTYYIHIQYTYYIHVHYKNNNNIMLDMKSEWYDCKCMNVSYYKVWCKYLCVAVRLGFAVKTTQRSY